MCNFVIYSHDLSLIKKYNNMISNNFHDIHLAAIASNKKELESILKIKKINLLIISYEDSIRESLSPLTCKIENKIIIYDKAKHNFKSTKHALFLSLTSSNEDALIKLKSFTLKINEDLIRKKVQKILEKFNFDFKLIGTKYLMEAIIYSYFTKETYFLENLEKQIYPYVSQKYNVSPDNIKWAIIRSINIMKSNSTKASLQSISLDGFEKITSKFVISKIVNIL